MGIVALSMHKPVYTVYRFIVSINNRQILSINNCYIICILKIRYEFQIGLPV